MFSLTLERTASKKLGKSLSKDMNLWKLTKEYSDILEEPASLVTKLETVGAFQIRNRRKKLL